MEGVHAIGCDRPAERGAGRRGSRRPRPVAAHGQAGTPRPPLGGDHGQAARRHRRCFDLRQGRKRRGRRGGDARGHLHDVGHARLGRRDAGARVRPAHEEGNRAERPRRGAHRRDAGVLQVEEPQVRARERPARGRHAGDAGRPDRHARGVGQAEPGRRPGAGDPDGRRLPDRGAARERARAPEEAALDLAVLEGGLPAARRAGARGARRRRGVRAEGPRCDPAQARRSRARGARRGQEPQGRAHGGLRPLLQGRHRGRARARDPGAGRPHHEGRPRAAGSPRLEEPVKVSYKGIDVYKLTVWTQGPAMLQALNLLEGTDLKALGLQLVALHPHRVPGDQHGLRRPRLLLRRPGRTARGAGQGPALEGVRAEALGRDARRPERSRSEAGRSLRVPGRHEPVQGGARRVAQRSRHRDRPARAGSRSRRDGPLPHRRRHDLGRRSRRGGLGRLDDAERRLEPGPAGRPHGHRPQPAHAGLRAGRLRQPVST